MTIYVGQIDESQKVYFKEQQVNSIQDDFITNCKEFKHCCMKTLADARKVADDYNADLASGKLFLKKCKGCGEYFFTNADEEEWFRGRGLKSPLRCTTCRKQRKQNK